MLGLKLIKVSTINSKIYEAYFTGLLLGSAATIGYEALSMAYTKYIDNVSDAQSVAYNTIIVICKEIDICTRKYKINYDIINRCLNKLLEYRNLVAATTSLKKLKDINNELYTLLVNVQSFDLGEFSKFAN